jgi:hypothetical protein
MAAHDAFTTTTLKLLAGAGARLVNTARVRRCVIVLAGDGEDDVPAGQLAAVRPEPGGVYIALPL